MPVSLKARLKRYLETNQGWHPKEQIIQTAKQAYESEKRDLSSEYVGRMLRTLAESGEIQFDYYKGKKGQDLVKYAALNVAKPPKPIFEVIIKDGTPVALVK